MAEYLIQGETLTNMADEIRTLSGTTGTMNPDEMTEYVADANAEITSQDALLDQAIAALEGKAAGSGGSGGGSVETCTVTIKYDSNISDVGFVPEGTFNILSTDGKIDYVILSETDATPESHGTGGTALTTWTHIVENVIKGSTTILANRGMDYEYGLETSGSIERLDCYFGMATAVAFQINGDCQIKFTPV